MHLLLTTYGTWLGKSGESFLVKTPEKKTEIPIAKIESIWISTAATLSTDVIQAALEHNIDIVFLDVHGDPIGRVWHVRLGSTAAIRRRQLEVALDERGLDLVREWVSRKMKNQAHHLRRLQAARSMEEPAFSARIDAILSLEKQLDQLHGRIDAQRERILGLEGSAAREYFDGISSVLPPEWRFDGRSHRPAHDPFNCTLNYGYGVLYSLVERACILAGLDPYVGILHTDNYNKQSFVFDMIEAFRVHVDHVVTSLFTLRQMHPDCFEQIEGGWSLARPGKAILMEALNAHLDAEKTYRGRTMKVRNTMLAECHAVANQLLERG